MANQEHLELLNQGVDIWNEWRKEHSATVPGFDGARLSGAHLSNVNLSLANLHGADLSDADLIDADLTRANLTLANLSHANLRRTSLRYANLTYADLRYATLILTYFSNAKLIHADLSHADLNGANLTDADLTDANLSDVSLISANLSRAELNRADFAHARIGLTIFGEVDLRPAKGLSTIEHMAPSTIGADAIMRSEGGLPEEFLRGAGFSDTFIAYVHSLISKPIDYYSCFISYSSRDEDFAKRLYADLQSNNVRCWFAPEDMKIGDKIRSRIDEAIRMHEKLLLVLSEHSVESEWVEKEAETAFERERQQQKLILFPLRLDDAVMKATQAWASDIRRTRHIGDFRGWKSHDDYQKALGRLLRDLKAGG